MGDINHFYSQRPWLELPKGPHTYFFFDDFTGLNYSANSGQNDYTYFETNGAQTLELDLTESGGVIKGTHTAADNEVSSLIGNAGIKVQDLKAGEIFEFGCRGKISDVDDCDYHVGQGIHDTSYQASEPADLACFRLVEALATGAFGVRVGKGGSYFTSEGIVTLADATWFRAFWQFKPESGNMDTGWFEWFIHTNNGYGAGREYLENKFPDNVPIFPVMQHQTGAAAAQTWSMDWIYVHGIRADYVNKVG